MARAKVGSPYDIIRRVPRRRVRLTLSVALVTTLSFAVGELWLMPDQVWVRIVCKLAQAAAMTAGLLVIWRHPSRLMAQRVGELGMEALVVLAAAPAILTGAVGVVPVVTSAVAMGSGAFLPLGVQRQMRIAACAALAVIADAYLRGGLEAWYPVGGAVLVIIGSVVGAWEADRNRRLVELSFRSQHAAEVRFKHLAASAPTVFWWLGQMADGNGRYISPAFDQIWGMPGGLAGRSIASVLETIHPDDRQRIFEAVQELAAKGLDEEFRIVRPDGSIRRVRTRAYLVERDAMPAVAGMTEDVTEQRRIEDALRRSQERYAGLVEHAPDPVLTFDGQGRLLSANPAMERLLGRSVAELTGTHFLCADVLARSSRRAAIRIARALADSAAIGPQELELRRPNGEFLVVESNQRVVRGAGESLVVEVILRDLTERRRAEEAERLRAFASYLDAVREEERGHFARRLHDDFAQSMAALGLHLGGLGRSLPRDLAEPIATVREMEHILTTMLAAVRKVISDLRPSVLDDFGLAAAVRWEAHDFQKRTGIECVADVETDDSQPIDERAVAVFRTVQAALDNGAARGASQVRVRCDISDGVIAVQVEDNGTPVASPGLPWDVVCMRERIQLLGGECEIAAPARGGMSVRMRVMQGCAPTAH